ncbi:MAG: hypothetical protein JXA18_03205 [Chitinispirillaceae bacterium]|nr:hypothetical protein [Chitinispirillaceae bacterium]
MEFAVIILATLSVVLLFQIIILVNQQKNGKAVRELMAQRAKPFQSERERFRDRKENSFRQQRHHHQDAHPKQPQAPSSSTPSGNADNVEKSLRDINLKLKNAERDQEVARRRIQENMGKEHPRRRHHNDNNRGGGGRDDGRDHRRDRRDRHNRNDWHNRKNQEQPYHDAQPPSPDLESPPVVTAELKPALPDLNPSDFDTDTTQHGRKFMVRRHPLQEEGEKDRPDRTEDVSSDPSMAPSPVTDSTTSTETTGQSEQTDDTEISFGRR